MTLFVIANHKVGLEHSMRRCNKRLRDDVESMVDMVDCTGLTWD